MRLIPGTAATAPVVLAVSVLALAACSSSGSGGSKNSQGASTPAGGGSSSSQAQPASGAATITIENFAFTGDLTVKPGTKVTVKDKDSVAHTLADKNGKFDTGNIDGGGTKTFTAPTADGSYSLICAYHPQMNGTLVVKG